MTDGLVGKGVLVGLRRVKLYYDSIVVYREEHKCSIIRFNMYAEIASAVSLVGIHVRAQNEALFRNEHRFSRASIIETR